ncbi:hypothetical protein ISN45_At03g050070 [Arabidopsis thaliana x Arabidopsis arenosa]|jgi:hypothetical protein|uniref:Uncharacterized protein n=2 Tax=Arabidopsis TaxID=3701 RepID=B3H6B2_ARATH|nr:uncharacterized protein AT3G57072 [Arabidopsis thaliana]AEE79611.1 hypothetical protein AT3G57072 [Arabidopsis thaliana]KAG7628809.1 hypothetical protein ISN45_At03g050070 [Arabidopsis thaliana x Arabidopsis arenosa]|eukprot:NP_001118851.1 hypothetical protein AT3G57072 [Arabidopsis thaliana]
MGFKGRLNVVVLGFKNRRKKANIGERAGDINQSNYICGNVAHIFH